MEITNLAESVSYLASFFHTLPPETVLRLECSLTLLKNEQQLAALYFFGQLEAQSATYWLAFGTPEADLFREQKLFYSRNATEWFLLLAPTNREPTDNWSLICEDFTGEVGNRFRLPASRLQEDSEANRPRYVLEQERLWYVFRALLREACCVPRGLLYRTDTKETIRNTLFRGLTEGQLGDLANYQHFRLPERDVEENLGGRPSDCILSMDVFDRIEDVVPRGRSFSLRVDDSGRFATCSSLWWLGAVSFHKANAGDLCGFYYRGDGRKNWDLPFQV
ncbi:radial spoke head protein 9 homolog [Anopheles albimanus]|uniref:Radial spoke head protein 9 homolog n=1 Tax=Anopheles albimanus TaxID=7167 RepID=A0A182FTN2_ANOAL|nr:radial spoke head protein 9 homolog [Anopheles albimanus]